MISAFRQYTLFLLTASSMLTGCINRHTPPNNWVKPNRIIEKSIPAAPTPIAATFGLGNQPAVVNAYQRFVKHGHAPVVGKNSFRTLPYQPYQRPIIGCSPLHLCVIQLEAGEQLQDLALGDSAHWHYHTAWIGPPHQGSLQIAIKPLEANTETDIVIATDRRAYTLGLISAVGQHSEVISFYYPQETIHQHHQFQTTIHPKIPLNKSLIAIDQLHFNYTLSGDKPSWRPHQVFDDGRKTLIEMPPKADHTTLPVLFVRQAGSLALINYRYQTPYLVVDGLFEEGWLISGIGRHQMRVRISHH